MNPVEELVCHSLLVHVHHDDVMLEEGGEDVEEEAVHKLAGPGHLLDVDLWRLSKPVKVNRTSLNQSFQELDTR